MAKLWYNEYVILILKCRKLYTYIDNRLVSFTKVKELKEKHINYVILDNLEIIKREYEDNNYSLYYLKYRLSYILNNINNKVRERIELDE